MRISDDRYSRDRQRLDLALRFIQHEARTRTIRLWTGLTDDRIRKLYRSYIADEAGNSLTRHRGKSPQQISFFTRTPRMRQEAAVLASVCYLLGVMPANRVADAQRNLPGMQRGEALCEAFETYRRLVPAPRISFEHAVFLITALARGDELRATLCGDCNGLIVVDRFSVGARRCLSCEDSRQGRLAFEE
jgi:Flagellar transcriptional activator (FlhC)